MLNYTINDPPQDQFQWLRATEDHLLHCEYGKKTPGCLLCPSKYGKIGMPNNGIRHGFQGT